MKIYLSFEGFKLTLASRLSSPLNNKDVEMRNSLLQRLGSLYKCEYWGRDNLFDAIYDQIIVLNHVRRMFLRGYMLNYMDLEWDNVVVNFKSYL